MKYDVPEGYQVHFEVYTENPFTTDADGLPVKKSDIEPIDGGYTDGNGNYSDKVSVSASVEKLDIYSSGVGVPRLMTAEVKGGVLSAAAVPVPGTSKAATKAVHLTNALPTSYADTKWFGYGHDKSKPAEGFIISLTTTTAIGCRSESIWYSTVIRSRDAM